MSASRYYLPPKAVGGTMAIAICERCSGKMYAGARVKDPNNGLMVHPECCDEYDPWRLPARQTEDISVMRPRPDTDFEPESAVEYLLTTDIVPTALLTESGLPLEIQP